MIYPTLHISPNQPDTVILVDTDYDEPVMTMQDSSGDAPDAFITLLTAFLNQYGCGWEDGYVDGLEDGDGEIMDGEYDED